MSADNGIYIAKFPEGWRVTYAQAIENIEYYPKGSKKRKKVLKKYFGDSKVFNNIEDVLKEAEKLQEEILNDDFGILEYGICNLGELESFEEDFNKTEFFECICQDRHHLIIARKEIWEEKDITISLEFVVERGDWEVASFRMFPSLNFFRKGFWRIKEALKILVKGSYRVEGYWEPIRTEKNEVIIGIEEMKRLGKTLIKYSKDAEKFINYNIKNASI